MIKILILISFFLIGCTSAPKPVNSGIDFEQVLQNQNLNDSEKIIELQIQLSKQQDKILEMKKNTLDLQTSFDSLKSSNDSMIFFLESQIDSFRMEQT